MRNVFFGSDNSLPSWLPNSLALLAIVTLSIIILNVLRQLVIPRRSRDPPIVFHWMPFIGSAITYGKNPLDFLTKCRDKYGNVFTFVLFGRNVTVAIGPQGNNFILGGKSTIFNAEDVYSHFTTPVFGKDVVYDVPNEKFMEQKKFIKAGLSTDNLRAYVSMITREVDQFINTDESFLAYQSSISSEKISGIFDVVKVMQEITILTASGTLQGREVRNSLDKTFAQLYTDLDGGFTPLHVFFPHVPLPSSRRRDTAQKKLSDFYVHIIRKRREGKGMGSQDMIEALMQQKYHNGSMLKDHEIAHLMITLLMAGQHTSSTTGSWVLLHIAANPSIQEALYQEQVTRFGNKDGSFDPLTYESLRTLPVLDSVIRETLRMHPPIHSIMRQVREDVSVPAGLASPAKSSITTANDLYIIPRGHYVLSSPLVSQMDPHLWDNASTWFPRRWMDQSGQAMKAYKQYQDEHGEKVDYGFGMVSKGTESPYQPFGAGKHRCIGEQFAYLQLGTIISTMVRKMELRIKDVPAHNYQTMIVMPQKPREITYRRR
ncbi:lanosterol 14-alpha-demethylase [Cyathus striatus]|nr:lanosterol 14-alpha-demethylase [Cyathus striatus]